MGEAGGQNCRVVKDKKNGDTVVRIVNDKFKYYQPQFKALRWPVLKHSTTD